MALQETLTVRAATVDDLRRIRLFLDAEMRQGGWPQGPDERLLRWKFFDGPMPAPCYAAFDGQGYLVGFSGSVGRRLCLRGRELKVTEATDTFVARSYWGLNAALAMRNESFRDHAERGYALRYGQPNAIALRSALRLGYRQLASTLRLTRLLSATVLRGRWPAWAVALARGPFAAASRLWSIPAWTTGRLGLRLAQLERFDERMDLLWDSARAGYDALLVRDRAYMDWRYAAAPLPYLRVGAYRGGRLVGTAVGRVDVSAAGPPVMVVADVITERDRGRIAYSLIGWLLREAHRRGCGAARADRTAAAGHDRVYRALRAHGFGFPRIAGTAIVRCLTDDPDVRALIDGGGWAYQAGDSDQG